MADALTSVKNLNKEVLSAPNNVASKSAYDVVSMAVASALQNEMMMHAGFETTTNTAINLATQKLAEAIAKKDAEDITNWTEALATFNKSRVDEAAGLAAFNKIAQDMVNQFPGGS